MVEFAGGFEVSWITCGAPVQEPTVKSLDGVGCGVVSVNVNGLGWTQLYRHFIVSVATVG